jgi:hypothetical protein
MIALSEDVTRVTDALTKRPKNIRQVAERPEKRIGANDQVLVFSAIVLPQWVIDPLRK